MHEAKEFKVAKWPFFVGDAVMLGTAYFVYWQGHLPLKSWEVMTICACVAAGAALAVVPFLLEYRGLLQLIEVSSLGTVTDKIQNMEAVAAQITSATNQWEVTQQQANKTAAGAKEIAERMAAEVREFSEFQQKMNDTEKATLRLEVDKLRRAENEWLQILVRLLDHIYALYAAAERSGQAGLITQIGGFQNACRDTARRVGLVPITAAKGEAFDTQKHRWADGEKPPESSLVSETLATGYTFQGRLIRLPMVQVQSEDGANAITATKPTAQSDLPLEAEQAGANE